MNRNSWIMFGMVSIVIMTMVLVALLILVPQSNPLKDASIEEYEAINPSEFSYTQSKDISQEAMKETYSVTTEDVKEGKASKLYKQGNTDPFADSDAGKDNNTNSSSTNTTTNTNISSATTNNNTNSGTSTAGNGNNTSSASTSSKPSSDKPASAEEK